MNDKLNILVDNMKSIRYGICSYCKYSGSPCYNSDDNCWEPSNEHLTEIANKILKDMEGYNEG